MRVKGLGFRVQGSGFRVQGLPPPPFAARGGVRALRGGGEVTPVVLHGAVSREEGQEGAGPAARAAGGGMLHALDAPSGCGLLDVSAVWQPPLELLELDAANALGVLKVFALVDVLEVSAM